jgi:hypothetical protein
VLPFIAVLDVISVVAIFCCLYCYFHVTDLYICCISVIDSINKVHIRFQQNMSSSCRAGPCGWIYMIIPMCHIFLHTGQRMYSN